MGAVDIDATKQNLDAGEAIGLRQPLGVPVSSELAEASEGRSAKVACVATSSSLAQASPEIIFALQADLHVISTCEELAYPCSRHR